MLSIRTFTQHEIPEVPMWLRCACLLLVVLPGLAVPVAFGGESRRLQQAIQRRPINRGPIDRGPIDRGPIDCDPIDCGPVNRNAGVLFLIRFAGKRRAVETPRFDSLRSAEEQSLEPWEFRRLERPGQEPVESRTSDWLVPQRRHLLPTGQGLDADI